MLLFLVEVAHVGEGKELLDCSMESTEGELARSPGKEGKSILEDSCEESWEDLNMNREGWSRSWAGR
jgi:hypothetical protein